MALNPRDPHEVCSQKNILKHEVSDLTNQLCDIICQRKSAQVIENKDSGV